MNYEELQSHIETTVNRQLSQKGLASMVLGPSSRFLGGDIPIDSLDLAVIVTELQRATKKDPFKDGFRNFQTVGDLARLYLE